MISPLKAFAIALAVGAAVPLAYAGKVRFDTMQAEQADRAFESSYKKLAPGVYVTAQIKPDDLARFRDRAEIKSVIDLRPDGEAADQTPSARMAAEARKSGLEFSYVPTPHGRVPGEVVTQFDAALAHSRKPVLLYCRSGSRAARVWALSEASRVGGLDAAVILAAVRAAGLSAETEKAEIEQRIAARKPN